MSQIDYDPNPLGGLMRLILSEPFCAASEVRDKLYERENAIPYIMWSADNALHVLLEVPSTKEPKVAVHDGYLTVSTTTDFTLHGDAKIVRSTIPKYRSFAIQIPETYDLDNITAVAGKDGTLEITVPEVKKDIGRIIEVQGK
jgi:HSP20 family molecular chaperone IbpA